MRKFEELWPVILHFWESLIT